MTKKRKAGRPANPGKVVGFYAPREMLENLEKALEYTGGTISAFLREGVNEKINQALTDHKGSILEKSTLNTYTGGSIENQKSN
jgi:hypothetical protein